MAANSAIAIPNAGMGAGTNNASAIVFRPIVWGDLDAVVDLFDRTGRRMWTRSARTCRG